jgi:hypothetical protein
LPTRKENSMSNSVSSQKCDTTYSVCSVDFSATKTPFCLAVIGLSDQLFSDVTPNESHLNTSKLSSIPKIARSGATMISSGFPLVRTDHRIAASTSTNYQFRGGTKTNDPFAGGGAICSLGRTGTFLAVRSDVLGSCSPRVFGSRSIN